MAYSGFEEVMEPMDNPSELVCDFVNTYDVESGVDTLTSPAALAAWLGRRDLVGSEDTAEDDHLALAVDLREALRVALRHNHDHEPGLPHPFAGLSLRVTLTTGGPVLEPVAAGVTGGLARIAVAVMGAQAEGMWPRLKVCTESTCQWAFVDSSKNRSRSWCSMRVCGNRTKTRAYRARRQTETGSRHL
ncbi:putative RNA-binding Zn ribbon-like protein [Streptosporangium album]|uniref:Putative RNA-binding Zn ribbon-like protein n=1 Tax=Streptosporangium album TaxID=47479 RepID=A0A7W7RZR3_9ACTN|nr:CGNR zinc finger domain-containing protein [Streptosporangium album]MBB4940583.1 putative RNA-binding Zn ribbon-like protein [Streptosporangium album]